MNTLFHFFFNYIIIELGYGNASQYLLPLIIASTVIDLDHVPYYFVEKKNILEKGLGERSRTFLHELPGLFVLSLFIIILFLIVSDTMLLKVVYMCFILHYVVDFAAGKTRPFHPFSKTVLVSPFISQEPKKKVLFETIATIIAGVLFWLLL